MIRTRHQFWSYSNATQWLFGHEKSWPPVGIADVEATAAATFGESATGSWRVLPADLRQLAREMYASLRFHLYTPSIAVVKALSHSRGSPEWYFSQRIRQSPWLLAPKDNSRAAASADVFVDVPWPAILARIKFRSGNAERKNGRKGLLSETRSIVRSLALELMSSDRWRGGTHHLWSMTQDYGKRVAASSEVPRAFVANASCAAFTSDATQTFAGNVHDHDDHVATFTDDPAYRWDPARDLSPPNGGAWEHTKASAMAALAAVPNASHPTRVYRAFFAGAIDHEARANIKAAFANDSRSRVIATTVHNHTLSHAEVSLRVSGSREQQRLPQRGAAASLFHRRPSTDALRRAGGEAHGERRLLHRASWPRGVGWRPACAGRLARLHPGDCGRRLLASLRLLFRLA